jgi:2-succinyl-6-hydroxy-2,4-cyclohexadiene-1-carboxylate synthase
MLYMLHGAVGHFSDWDGFIPMLAAGDANLVDLYDDNPDGFDSFAVHLNAVSSDEDVLIGYSMGGRLALHALVHESSQWSRAVIISSHTGIMDDATRQERILSDQSWAKLAEKDVARFLDKWSRQPVFGGREMPWSQTRNIVSSEKLKRCFTSWSLGNQRNLLPELERIQVPVLWITGQEDEKFTNIAVSAVEKMKDAQLEVIPDAGHRCPWEQPELTSAVIRGFLSS